MYCRWYELDITIKELKNVGRIINESSWWENFGECPTVLDAAAKLENVTLRLQKDNHFHRIKKIQQMAVSEVIIGVSTSWAASQHKHEGITLLDGNHRSIHFVMTMNDTMKVKLLLGISSKFARNWRGNFYCKRKRKN